MVAWHMMEMIKQMNMPVGIKANKVGVPQNRVIAPNAQTAQMTTSIRVTLEVVTMLGYCSGLTMAMSLSILIPAIINSEVAQRLIPTVIYAWIITCFRLSDCEYKLTKLLTIKNGCATKPTKRSVDASPQSNMVDGERRAGVFHTPYNTNAFPLIATKARGTFATQLAMMMKC